MVTSDRDPSGIGGDVVDPGISPGALLRLAEEAELAVEATYGSHDLEPLDEGSERCIIVLRRAASSSGMG